MIRLRPEHWAASHIQLRFRYLFLRWEQTSYRQRDPGAHRRFCGGHTSATLFPKQAPSYHISKASLMRWNKRFDGSRQSLADGSHRPTGHVNSITVFLKCHHGWSYHPTSVNEMHPYLKFDLLQAQLDACKEIGVRAPVYISAGLDEKEAVRYPEWLFQIGRAHV